MHQELKEIHNSSILCIKPEYFLHVHVSDSWFEQTCMMCIQNYVRRKESVDKGIFCLNKLCSSPIEGCVIFLLYGTYICTWKHIVIIPHCIHLAELRDHHQDGRNLLEHCQHTLHDPESTTIILRTLWYYNTIQKCAWICTYVHTYMEQILEHLHNFTHAGQPLHSNTVVLILGVNVQQRLQY